MSAYSEHAAGLAELQDEAGNECPSFVWKGKTIRCLPGGALRKKDLDDGGGLALDADLSLTVLVSAFDYPSIEALVNALAKSNLNYQGHRYRVETVTVAPSAQQLNLKCTDVAKGLGKK